MSNYENKTEGTYYNFDISPLDSFIEGLKKELPKIQQYDVECIEPKPLPKLPVASALWKPMPNFEIGAGAWILAGGTHHSCFSYDLTAEYWEDYAEIAGIEMVHINKDTTIDSFKKELRMNEVYYMLNKALC
jgi:L-arabinose isomerase